MIRERLALLVTLTTICVSMLITALLTYDNNLEALGASGGDQQNLVYDKPYTRVGPYLIGTLTAMVLLRTDKRVTTTPGGTRGGVEEGEEEGVVC